MALTFQAAQVDIPQSISEHTDPPVNDRSQLPKILHGRQLSSLRTSTNLCLLHVASSSGQSRRDHGKALKYDADLGAQDAGKCCWFDTSRFDQSPIQMVSSMAF